MTHETSKTAGKTAATAQGSKPEWKSRQLLICHASGSQLLPLRTDTEFVVGRSAPADVVVPEPSISRQHARVSITEDAVTVTDLASTNGVWVNDDRIKTAELRVDADYALGGKVTLRLVHGLSHQDQVRSRDELELVLQQEVERSRHSGRAIAVAMLMVGPSRRGHADTLVSSVQRLLGPLDYLSCHASSVLAVLLVGRDAKAHRDFCERLLEVADEMAVGLASLHDSPSSALGLIELAQRRMRAAGKSEPLIDSSYEATDGEMVASSPGMIRVLELVQSVAKASLPVLLVGETGSGKEVIATEIHRRSPRAEGPMRILNCGAIPSQLAESLLFGHERGAFTGAESRRKGLFEEANGGSVFLDEIGELPMELQAKLLRVLESKKVTRVGSHDEIPFDARIISATHRDLDAMCEEGTFRRDLFFRLNGIEIALPPLRDRGDDIERLAEKFLAVAAQDLGNHSRLSDAARARLRTYSWPGNVRELRNVMERAVVVAETSVIGTSDFPARMGRASSSRAQKPSETTPALVAASETVSLDEQLIAFETGLVLAALASCDGNKSRAAVLLQMPRRSFSTKVAELGVEARRAEGEAASESIKTLLGTIEFKAAVEDLESAIIREALARHDGNRAAAARDLAVPAHVVTYKAKKYAL